MIKKVNNVELLALLNDREAVFEGCVGNWDDEQLSQFLAFKGKYNSLTQLQKDIYYLYLIIGSKKTAELMQVSQRFINYKVKEIKELMK